MIISGNHLAIVRICSLVTSLNCIFTFCKNGQTKGEKTHTGKVEQAFRNLDFGEGDNVPQVENIIMNVNFDSESDSGDGSDSEDE